jgi:hypothetical protein
MGADIVAGGYAIAYMGLFEALHVAPVYSTKSGYALKTNFQSPRRMNFLEVWSYGKQYPYVKSVTEKIACLIPPCVTMISEQGIISLSEAEFTGAASQGFEFEMAGKAGKIVGKVPAASFRAVLDRKAREGFVTAPRLAPALPAGTADPDITDNKM